MIQSGSKDKLQLGGVNIMNRYTQNLSHHKSPCYQCQNRHTACHSNCKQYKLFREKIDQEHKEKIENCTYVEARKRHVRYEKHRKKNFMY